MAERKIPFGVLTRGSLHQWLLVERRSTAEVGLKTLSFRLT